MNDKINDYVNNINIISSNIDWYNHSKELKYNECNAQLLKILAKGYRINLDDPEWGERFYDDSHLNKNPDVVQLDKSMNKAQALIKFIKRTNYLNNLFKKREIDYFDKLWKENLSDEWYEFCKNMYEKYNILPIADQELLDYFSRVMWTVYNWASLWKFSIVRNRSSIENWSGRIKHEWIHAQQWWLKKRISSFGSILNKKSELSWLVPWAMDYATDNQISDWETYINQYKKDPIKDIKPYEFKKYRNKENRFEAIRNHMQTDIDEMKWYIEELKTKIMDIKSDKITLDAENDKAFTKKERLQNLEYILEAKAEELKAMEKLQSEHDNTEDWHQVITYGEQDAYLYQETPEKRQTNFQSEESFRKQVVVDMFITHYWDRKDNYKKWVEVYLEHKDKLDDIVDNYLKHKNKRELKKEMNKVFKQIEKEGKN